MFIILLSSILFETTLCTLSISNPSGISQSAWQLNYSVSNFGHIPYGKVLSGIIMLPPIYSGSDLKFCDSLELDKSNMYFRSTAPRWIIVNRGDCPFTRKVLNSQAIQAQLVVIVDNRDESVDSIIMADDGQGYQVKIPSILITKTEGEQLIKLLQGNQPNEHIVGTIIFNETQQSAKPSVLFGLNVENRDTFRLLRDFRPYYESIKDNMEFDIYYEFLTCPRCKQDDYKYALPDCIGGGRYCMPDPDQEGVGVGSDIVREQLRQLCLWQTNSTLWWNYMEHFDSNCVNPKGYEECFTKFIGSKATQQALKCVVDSFDTSVVPDQLMAPNMILDEQLDLKYNTGIIFYPGVSINSKAYRGNVEALEIFEAVCMSMEDPSQCQMKESTQEIERKAEQQSYLWLIMFMIGGSVLFALFMICIYRRMVKIDQQKVMKVKVDEMVNQYIKFYEQQSDK